MVQVVQVVVEEMHVMQIVQVVVMTGVVLLLAEHFAEKFLLVR